MGDVGCEKEGYACGGAVWGIPEVLGGSGVMVGVGGGTRRHVKEGVIGCGKVEVGGEGGGIGGSGGGMGGRLGGGRCRGGMVGGGKGGGEGVEGTGERGGEGVEGDATLILQAGGGRGG